MLSLFVNVLFVSTNVRMQHVIILISIQISALSIPRVINDSKFKVFVNPYPGRPPVPDHPDLVTRKVQTYTLLCVIMCDVNRVCISVMMIDELSGCPFLD